MSVLLENNEVRNSETLELIGFYYKVGEVYYLTPLNKLKV